MPLGEKQGLIALEGLETLTLLDQIYIYYNIYQDLPTGGFSTPPLPLRGYL